MKFHKPTYFTIIVGMHFLVIGCQLNQEKTIELDPVYQKFENLVSMANCYGPNGKYETEVQSTKDNYTYFKQEFESENDVFEAYIVDGKFGFSINGDSEVKDTLSKESIEIIKSHEFHKIHMLPNLYFRNIVYSSNELYHGKMNQKFNAIDVSSNGVSLFYDIKEKLISGIIMVNPVDTTEQIEIIYRDWMDSKFGKIAKKIEIIQGGKDVYIFDYKIVRINEMGFEKKIKINDI